VSETALDLIGAVGGTVYLALFVPAVALQWKGATLRRLTLALRMFCAALVVELVVLASNVAQIGYDGVWMPLVNVVTVACCVSLIVFTVRRRRDKGDEVMRDAERIVRDFLNDSR
jgi:K+ transporter